MGEDNIGDVDENNWARGGVGRGGDKAGGNKVRIKKRNFKH